MPLVVPTYFTAVNGMSPTMNKIGMDMNKLAVKGRGLQGALNGSFAGGMVGPTAIGFSFLAATKAAMDFEKQMTNVATLMDTTKESVSSFSDSVLALSKKSPLAIQDLTESLYQIRSEGYLGAQAIDILTQSAKLATTGLSTGTEAAKSMATAIRVFGKESLTTQQIADIFFKTVSTGRTKMEAINESFGENAALVASAGVKFAEFQAATAALTNAGLTASTAQTDFAQAILALTKPTETMISLLGAMGHKGSHAGEELISASGGMVNAMDELNKAAERTHTSIEKAFGRKQGLIANKLLTTEVKEQFRSDLKLMMSGANQIDEAYRKQEQTTATQLQLLKNSVSSLGITIGNELAPPTKELLKLLSGTVDVADTFIHSGLFEVVKDGAIVWGIWKSAVLANNAVLFVSNTYTGIARGLTSNLTGALSENVIAFKAETAAIKARNFALKGGAFWSLLALSSYKALRQEIDKNSKLKEINPLGLDFSKDYAGNVDKLKQFGVSEDQYGRWQKKYLEKTQSMEDADNMDPWKNPVGVLVYKTFKKSHPGAMPSGPGTNTDSTRNSIDSFYNNLNNPTTKDNVIDAANAAIKKSDSVIGPSASTSSIGNKKLEDLLQQIADNTANNTTNGGLARGGGRMPITGQTGRLA